MVIRKPQRPQSLTSLLHEYGEPTKLTRIFQSIPSGYLARHYLHWDKLRYMQPPKGLTSKEWWFALKVQRLGQLRPVPLVDTGGDPFRFFVPDLVHEELHDIDCGAGGSLRVPEPINNPQTRDQYLLRSLMEEAITY